VAIIAHRCDPALEILDAVHYSNPVNPLEHSWEPENMHKFPDPFFKVHGIYVRMQATSIILSQAVTMILPASGLSPLQDTPKVVRF